MSKRRKSYRAKRKAEIALEAIKETATQSQLSSRYDVHPSQLKSWKQTALAAIRQCFSKQQERQSKAHQKQISQLYEQIGELHTQLDWLKKKHNIQH
ncbi:MAG: transposase [Pseudomonadota bacterium]